MPLYLFDDDVLGVWANRDPCVVHRHLDRYRRAIELADKTGGAWLDVACGSGYGSRLVTQLAQARCIGVDGDVDAIAFAHRHYERLPEVTYHRASIEDVLAGGSPSSEKFDVILSIETLEHLSKEMQNEFVGWCAGRLKPQRPGRVPPRLVIATPVGENKPSNSNPEHVHELSIGALASLCMRHFVSVRTSAVEQYVSTTGELAQQVFCVAERPMWDT